MDKLIPQLTLCGVVFCLLWDIYNVGLVLLVVNVLGEDMLASHCPCNVVMFKYLGLEITTPQVAVCKWALPNLYVCKVCSVWLVDKQLSEPFIDIKCKYVA